jgi:hypothetical protein
MLKNPRDFFIQNVRVAYQDFFDARKNTKFGENKLLRLGINAATNLYHLREHFTPVPRFSDVVARCPDYTLVRDIANISKHKTITRYNPQVKNLLEYRLQALYEDEKGSYQNCRVEVLVSFANGPGKPLADILFNVMSMWCVWLRQNNIIVNLANPESVTLPNFVKREDAVSVPLEILASEKRNLRCRVVKYDPITDELRPVDLTGAKIELQTAVPPRFVGVKLQIPEHQISADVDIPLTEEQGERYIELPQHERARYVFSLVEQSDELQKLIQSELQKSLLAKTPNQPSTSG